MRNAVTSTSAATPEWFLDVQVAASDAVYPRNDDAFGHTPRRLWVLDGATGVSKRRCTRDSSDAAWLAQAASAWLAADAAPSTAQSRSAPMCLYALEGAMTAAFAEEMAQSGARNVTDVDMPSACLGLVQIEGDHLAMACVGDVTVAVHTPGGADTTFSDHASAAASQRTLKTWLAARARGVPDDQLWEQVRPVILKNREEVNRPGGYRVIHPVRRWASGVPIHHMPLVAGMQVLLASDGLWRLVDLFADMTAASLMQQLGTPGWPQVLARLRALEQADARGERHPRVKCSDDATAVLATVCRAPQAGHGVQP